MITILRWLAEFAQENLAKEIDRCLAENKNKKFENEDEYITTSIKEAFDGVVNFEESFRKNIRKTSSSQLQEKLTKLALLEPVSLKFIL